MKPKGPKQKHATQSAGAPPTHLREGSSPHVSVPPLAPRRRLLWILSAAVALWVALLLVIYMTVVYPTRPGRAGRSGAPLADVR